MPRFLVLYRSSVSAQEQMASATPEQMKSGMDAWMAWAGQAGSALTDLGAPLKGTRHLEGGAESGSTSDVSGYSLIEAASTDAATALLQGHPHLNVDGNSIELLELMAMPGA